ncbi:hypothetical protein HOD30_02470 [Candidatus Peregrinibacteria bacterium]|nr:hypothetical protein [Candidatus Peregrinibacteria bacterium]
MSDITQICRISGKSFVIDEGDLALMKKLTPVVGGQSFDLPIPLISHEELLRRQLIWRAELHLFNRKSDFSGKAILSFYPADADCTVYTPEEWYSDAWDAKDYGRDFDFSRPFFDQFAELVKIVPLLSMAVLSNENSDYINNAGWNKNCYLITAASRNEDCYYSNYINDSSDCMDCSFVLDSELCYQCIDSVNCYSLKYSANCRGCSDSAFLENCRNCQECFGSVNLLNKRFVFFNEQLSEEDYNARVAEFSLHLRENVERARALFEVHRLKFPYKYMHGEMNENADGSEIFNSRNIYSSFNVSNCEDCRRVVWFQTAKDCMSSYAFGMKSEQIYSCLEAGATSQRIYFSASVFDSCLDIFYSYCTVQSQNCFGCVGMQRGQYCILNKQYSKEEYEELVPKIIEHMKTTGEWGEFFPMKLSPLAYNQTIAQDYLPLDAGRARELGAKWANETEYERRVSELPENIDTIPESFCEQILYCNETGQPYRVIKQELAFYKKMQIPIPNKCFWTRHMARLKKRLPWKLWDRPCDKCSVSLRSAYEPGRPETVYCEACYLAEVY